ncbi:MAG: M1 family peptidase, partial [Myxococcales bacterium]|nr:M1 family peptidase [Myxococcales bacterium]
VRARRRIRLPGDVRPIEVSLHVEVRPQRDERFRGEVTHRLRLTRGRSAIEMHSDGLKVSRVRAESSRGVMRGRVVADPGTQKIEIQFPDRLPAGEVTLSMAFRGKLRGDLRGLYGARSGKRRYAFTQLEAAEARRFFPCLDEPAMKARFEISVTTDAGNTVLSNSPAAKVEPLPGGLKTVHFKPTPPLSTYLLALAVGELEASPPASCGDTEIRTWHVPGRAGLSDFGLEVARETLARLEKYFDLPYPYEKLDLVAVPDFEAGAMENAGAVFFRETLLLVDPQTATAQEKKRVAEVVCHELAHMWYGNLVTMAWWDDLWLNEAFATWMAFHIVDAWKPEWRMWHDFQHYRSAALRTDALRHSHPIYAAVRTPDEATENFDVITYEKGASVVRMLERYLGPEVFRAGVRTYIRRHREGNAVASDLWQALTEAAGFDVERIIRTWIEQAGFPLLHVRRKERGDQTELHFRQERFTLGDAPASDALWPIPWLGRIGTKTGRTHTARKLITGKSGKLVIEKADPRFIYGNADEAGFFRPIHHTDELARLLKHLQALSAVERLGLVGHQWAAVRAGHAPLRSYLELAMALGDESDPDVLIGLVSALSFIEDRIARDPEVAAAFRLRVREVFGPALRELGLDPGGEDDLASLRRAALLDLVAQVGGDAELIAAAAARCDAYLKDSRSLDPNLADGIVHLAARDGDAALYERFGKAAARAETPQARRRMLAAQTSFRDPKLIDRTLRDLLSDRVETQDVAILLARLLHNPVARAETWAFMKRRWPALRKRMPAMLVTRPIDALPALGTRRDRRDVASFFRAHPVSTGARAVRQALERFDLDLNLVERAEPGLARWVREEGGAD